MLQNILSQRRSGIDHNQHVFSSQDVQLGRKGICDQPDEIWPWIEEIDPLQKD
ncbi:hypothetical protein [Candidatus Contubernalis alkaliaceticus]|uniref:hypothetical protein n=1 Tax=Candidatus Contubernalis alkaliaceticus TaxID=338645 RepID=UPI001F4C16BD|nr:hypothetical protein [Candidatus Contubernalis alkalaceticus]UNC92822.1 hypothetical protein HUE98_12375 [Candidatus Contubernalis alkalaceticus]